MQWVVARHEMNEALYNYRSAALLHTDLSQVRFWEERYVQARQEFEKLDSEILARVQARYERLEIRPHSIS